MVLASTFTLTLRWTRNVISQVTFSATVTLVASLMHIIDKDDDMEVQVQ